MSAEDIAAWDQVQQQVKAALCRAEITMVQARRCLTQHSPKIALAYLRGYRREHNPPTPLFIPNPKPMSFANLKFPAAAVFAVAIITPLVDHALTGGFSPATYVIESICAASVVVLVAVGFVNTVNDK